MRYLQLHILLYDKHDDKSDDGPLIFYHAELPEIMLEMVQQAFNKDFFIGSAKMRCIPSLALSVLTNFFYAYSDTFLLVPEKLFRDSAKVVEVVTMGLMRDKLSWFDKLMLVQMFGAASHSRGCILFLQRHPNIIYELCTMIYRGMKTVEEKLRNKEINWHNETLTIFLNTFRDDEDLETTAKLLGIHTMNQSVMIYRNIVESTLLDYSLFQEVGKMVMKAEVLQHFPFLVKYIMIWFEPGLYLNMFLEGVSHTLSMNEAVTELLEDDYIETLERKDPMGIETFKFWNHDTKHPNTVAWLLLHALTLSKRFGSDWCTTIVCHVLEKEEDYIVNEMVKHYGQDLMDLAFLTEITSPQTISVQSIILEAILRYGGIQHKEYAHSNVFEGEEMWGLLMHT